MATPVGTFTVDQITSRILSRLPADKGESGVVNPASPLRVKILNELNLQIAEMYKKVNSDEIQMYYIETPITFTNNLFNMRSISDYDQFVELREETYGSINKVSTTRLEKLFNSVYYDDVFCCAVYGDNLKLFVGNSLSTAGRIFSIKYLRLPFVLLAPNDLLDIPDNYIEKLIDNIVAIFSSNNEKKSK